MHVLLALIGGVVFGLIAVRLRLLTRSGAAVAGAFGVTLLLVQDVAWIAPALAFFIPSSLLSKLHLDHRSDSIRRAAKTDVRDAVQVLANGGVAWVLVIAWMVIREPLLLAAYVGALAAASSDTWATEVGTIARGRTRSIMTLRRVPVGESGGVSLQGFAGAAVGAIVVALAGVAAESESVAIASRWGTGLLIAAAGFAASVVDSVMGAAIQGLYHDPATGELSEKRPAGVSPAVPVRGFAWIDNDVVNAGATAVGASLAALLVALSGGLYEI